MSHTGRKSQENHLTTWPLSHCGLRVIAMLTLQMRTPDGALLNFLTGTSSSIGLLADSPQLPH